MRVSHLHPGCYACLPCPNHMTSGTIKEQNSSQSDHENKCVSHADFTSECTNNYRPDASLNTAYQVLSDAMAQNAFQSCSAPVTDFTSSYFWYPNCRGQRAWARILWHRRGGSGKSWEVWLPSLRQDFYLLHARPRGHWPTLANSASVSMPWCISWASYPESFHSSWQHHVLFPHLNLIFSSFQNFWIGVSLLHLQHLNEICSLHWNFCAGLRMRWSWARQNWYRPSTHVVLMASWKPVAYHGLLMTCRLEMQFIDAEFKQQVKSLQNSVLGMGTDGGMNLGSLRTCFSELVLKRAHHMWSLALQHPMLVATLNFYRVKR